MLFGFRLRAVKENKSELHLYTFCSTRCPVTLLDAICGRFRISGMDEVGWVLEIRFWVDGLGVRVSGLGWVWVVDIRWCGGWVGVGLVRVMLLHIPFQSKPVDIRRGGGWVGVCVCDTRHLHSWSHSALALECKCRVAPDYRSRPF